MQSCQFYWPNWRAQLTTITEPTPPRETLPRVIPRKSAQIYPQFSSSLSLHSSLPLSQPPPVPILFARLPVCHRHRHHRRRRGRLKMMRTKNATVAKKQHQGPMLANSPHRPHRPAWTFQSMHNIPITTYIPGGPMYLGRPTMGSFPVCPPYNPAHFASASAPSAASAAFIVPPYPAYNSYEHSLYSSAGSSYAASSDPPSPPAAVRRRPKPPPKTFEITIPRTGRQITVMFVERVAHITAPVEYGIVPVDPDERAQWKACYNMQVLNATPTDKIAFRAFYVDDKWMKEGRESILGQLLSLGIVEPVKRVHYDPRGKAFMVKVLLKEDEVRSRSLRLPTALSRAHSCDHLPRLRTLAKTRVIRILCLSLRKRPGLASVLPASRSILR